MSHVTCKLVGLFGGETLAEYRANEMKQARWETIVEKRKQGQGVSDEDLDNHFEFLNGAVLNRGSGKNDQDVLQTTTGLFGPIRSHTLVHLDVETGNIVVVNDQAPMNPEAELIKRLNDLHDKHTQPPECSLEVNGFWTAAIDGAGITGLDGSANVFGSTGQLICDTDHLDFPLLSFGDTPESQTRYLDTLAYYGGTLLAPKEEFALGFTQDLWGIQYDQKLPEYIEDYEFAANKGGGLFVEHHPFPHIWLPAPGKDPVFGEETVSRILLGRRCNTTKEDGYYRTVTIQTYHFTMFEVPNDGSALAIRPQCIHNDSFTKGAQTVFLANTAANTVALRHSVPINKMSAGGVPVANL